MRRPLSALMGLLIIVFGLVVVSQEKGSPVDERATYGGRQECKRCHEGLAQQWEGSPHAALAKIGNLPADMVGCEACHGPGRAHIQGDRTAIVNPAKLKGIQVNDLCLKCHGPPRFPIPQDWRRLNVSLWLRDRHFFIKGLSCLACHSEHAGKERLLKKGGDDVCLDCHVLPEGAGKGQVFHAPFAEGECRLCHQPHGSKNGASLRPDIGKACGECHRPKKVGEKHRAFGFPWGWERANCARCHQGHMWGKGEKGLKKYRHHPFARRRCQTCHASPQPNDPFPLKRSRKELCMRCHPIDSLLEGDEKVVHLPVEGGLCLACHEPHAASLPHLLKKPLFRACITCHSDVGTSVTFPFKHRPFVSGRCRDCHKGHASRAKGLLVRSDSLQLCKRCHQQQHQISHPYGLWGKGREKRLIRDPRTGKTMTCLSCHEPHASPFTFLTPKDPRRDLCISCHRTMGG